MHHCNTCGATWAKRNRRAILAMGPCPGDNAWASAIPPSLDAPWIYPRASQQKVCWLGREIHSSQKLQYYRGCIYCSSCGARSATNPSPALSVACLLRPLSPRVQRRLKSMLKGVWPDPPGDWPLPLHFQAPNGFVLMRPFADPRLPADAEANPEEAPHS